MGRINNSPALREESRPAAQTPSMGMNFSQVLSPATIREIATVQGQMMIAKSYPRNMVDVYDKVQKACDSNNLAKASAYAYARGGTSISGPTIRLAEVLAKAYGNMKYGFEEVDSTDKETKVRSYAFDMETNTVAERVFTVPHIRYTREGGNKVLTDPRDIYEIIANNAQRRVRACILEIVPGDVVDFAIDACTKTRAAHIDKSPEKMQTLLKCFARYEVSKAQIEQYIQRKFEAIEDTQWIRLQDIYQSLKDGMAKAEDFFKPVDNITPNVVSVQDPEPVDQPEEPAPKMPISENKLEDANGPEAFDDAPFDEESQEEPEEF